MGYKSTAMCHVAYIHPARVQCRIQESHPARTHYFCELQAACAVDKTAAVHRSFSMQERLLPALRLSPPNRGNDCSGGWFCWGRSHIGSGAGFEGLFGAVVV